ncbi:hypothetical protein ACIGMX_34575 [Streptomyces aquilus]|uniref:hypothetical protein n=1 Tax=Streptomyces aquilus TaxID=2548456 RepID=UPI0037CF3FE2
MAELAHRQQQSTGPTVWVLATGVVQEPGEILGIYTERDLAIGDLIANAYKLTAHFPLTDTSGEMEDGTLHLAAGGEWLSLEPYPLITATQLA